MAYAGHSYPNHYTDLIAQRLWDVLPNSFASLEPYHGTLHSAMRVCHDWADAAGDVLWLSLSTTLLFRVPAGRRQSYANRIQQLNVSEQCNEPADEPSEPLSFHRLRQMFIWDSATFSHLVSRRLASADAAAPLPPMWPRLELLQCHDSDLLSPALQAMLVREPPLLCELVVRSEKVPAAEHTSPLLASALQHCGPDTLRMATSRGAVSVSAVVFAHMAGHRGL